MDSSASCLIHSISFARACAAAASSRAASSSLNLASCSAACRARASFSSSFRLLSSWYVWAASKTWEIRSQTFSDSSSYLTSICRNVSRSPCACTCCCSCARWCPCALSCACARNCARGGVRRARGRFDICDWSLLCAAGNCSSTGRFWPGLQVPSGGLFTSWWSLARLWSYSERFSGSPRMP